MTDTAAHSITIGASAMDDPTVRFAPPAVSGKARRAPPRNPDVCDVNQVADLLGISRRTLERELDDPASNVPKPFRVGRSTKRVWLRSHVIEYRAALAYISRTRGAPHAE
jgi:hypothetical protein